MWGVRGSAMDLSRYGWPSRLDTWTERALARFANLVIAASHTGRDNPIRPGFPAPLVIVIPNGIDTDRFRFDPDRRCAGP